MASSHAKESQKTTSVRHLVCTCTNNLEAGKLHLNLDLNLELALKATSKGVFSLQNFLDSVTVVFCFI
jgi:hypothetical protein